MINDIPTFLEIVAQDHPYRPDEDRLPEADVKEIETLVNQLEALIDKMVEGGSENYLEVSLLSERTKNFLLCLLFDEIAFWRTEDAK